jgi:VanZ family protein
MRTVILGLWVVLMGCVVVGSLLPGSSPVMAAVGRLQVSDKVLHFGAYLGLAVLPVMGFRERGRGVAAGLSMFVLGVLLEEGQHWAPGRSVELGDVIANGLGVGCGVVGGIFTAETLRTRRRRGPDGPEV